MSIYKSLGLIFLAAAYSIMSYGISCILVLIMLSYAAQAETFQWKSPTHREDGTKLELDELGGYEFLGTDAEGNQIWVTVLESGAATKLTTPIPPEISSQIVRYKIAVYDINGLYSEFVVIVPKEEDGVLLPPTDGRLEAPTDGRLE